MRHVQHLSLESLVKMDHFQKEPPLNLKGTTGAQGGTGPVPAILKEQIGNPAQTECPLWVISGHGHKSARYPRHLCFNPASGHGAAGIEANICLRVYESTPQVRPKK